MAVFLAGISGQSALQLQLTANAGQHAHLREVCVSSDTLTGSATYPLLTRPPVVGVPSASIFGLSEGGIVSSMVVATAYSTPPFFPTPAGTINELPFASTWIFPPGSEMVVGPSGGMMLFSTSAGGHTWSATMIWEEK